MIRRRPPFWYELLVEAFVFALVLAAVVLLVAAILSAQAPADGGEIPTGQTRDAWGWTAPRPVGTTPISTNVPRAPIVRYHRVSILALQRTRWTHVEVAGLVARVETEADGDWHITVGDGTATCNRLGIATGHCFVAEVRPADQLQIARPRVGDRIRVRGISRCDRGHGRISPDGACTWAEVHPVDAILKEDQ